MSNTSYKLFYFNFKGRAEVIRWIFEIAEQKYEDIRFEREEWKNIKSDAPFGQAPFLEVINSGAVVLKLAQSCAIARYLARKFKLAGKTDDDEQQAEVDSYVEQINDLITEMVASGVFREADLSKKREIESKLVKEVWPKHLKIFEEKLAKNNGWLVGDNLTWCDLYLCVVLEWIGLEAEALLARFAHCRVLENKIKSIPKIAEWIRSRPETNL